MRIFLFIIEITSQSFNKATVFERLAIYKDEYTKNEKQFKEVLDSLVETPESHNLMLNFVNRVLL